jgi:formate dehydrogenase subunit delta
MNAEKLIRMANQIATFFDSLPDHDQAVSETALHLQRTWDPRMRRALFAHVDEHGLEGLRPLLAEALQAHRQTLEPGRATTT